MKELKSYILEKLKINKESSLDLAYHVMKLCGIEEGYDKMHDALDKWIKENNVKEFAKPIICDKQTLENLKLDNPDLYDLNDDRYSRYIEAWHDSGGDSESHYLYNYTGDQKSNKFSISEGSIDDYNFLVIGQENCWNGFKCLVFVDNERVK